MNAASPARPRIDRARARRIDRLAFFAHLFHRYAHHPLCAEYAGELIPLGRRARICKGCALAAMGAIAGAMTSIFYSFSISSLYELASAFAIGAVAWSLTRWFRTRSKNAYLPRGPLFDWLSKLLTRALPAALGSFALITGIRDAWPAALISVLAISLAIATYQRFGPSRAPCQACPELHARPACRGYRPIFRRERAFARRASSLL